MDQKIRIIVAESREVFRKSLVALLQTQPRFQITGDAANSRELLMILKQTPPDIVLLDAELSVMDGKAALGIIMQRFPDVKVIVLSDRLNAQLQADFMACGASSFLGKNCSVGTFFTAIQKVKTEGYFFDDATSKALLATVLKDKQRAMNTSLVPLSDRETEILKSICNGNTNKEIAMNLHLSASTIDFYKTKIYHKTKCNSATGLLKYALKNGIVELS